VYDGTTLLSGLPGVRVERVERFSDRTRVVHIATTVPARPGCSASTRPAPAESPDGSTAPRRRGGCGSTRGTPGSSTCHRLQDRSGPARLHDVVAGRSVTALASWLSAHTADFAQTVQVIAMDGLAGNKTVAAQVMS
jgi:hypothetical protein